MDSGLWFVALGVVAAIVVVVVRRVARARRQREVLEVGRRMGLAPAATDPLFSYPFRFLAKGDERGTENVLAGSVDDAPVTLFDYWYDEISTDGDGNRQRRRFRYTCGVVRIGAACPPMSIGHENLLTRAVSALGFRDVELESEDFNRRFRLTCRDERFAFAFCDAGMIEHLLRLPDTFALEVVGPWLLLHSRPLQPPDWWTMLRELRDTRRRVPSVVPSLYPMTEGAA